MVKAHLTGRREGREEERWRQNEECMRERERREGEQERMKRNGEKRSHKGEHQRRQTHISVTGADSALVRKSVC